MSAFFLLLEILILDILRFYYTQNIAFRVLTDLYVYYSFQMYSLDYKYLFQNFPDAFMSFWLSYYIP